MGGIHPRIKKPVGERLATVAMAVAYGGKGISAGPQITGCKMASSSSSLTISFDPKRLGGEAVVVQPYNHSTVLEPFAGLSAMQVLLNASFFCVEAMLRCKMLTNGTRPAECPSGDQEWVCLTDGQRGSVPLEVFLEDSKEDTNTATKATQDEEEQDVRSSSVGGIIGYRRAPAPAPLAGTPPRNPYEAMWITLPVQEPSRGSDDAAAKMSVVVDLTLLNGSIPVAVRYAWGINCCKTGEENQGIAFPCPLKSCPIVSSTSMLPANPFMAKIIRGKCKCIAPQVCDV